MFAFKKSACLLGLIVLASCGGGGGNNQTIGSGVSQLSSSEPESKPPSSSLTPEPTNPQPEIAVNLQSPGGLRDTSIKYLFQAELDKNPEVEPYLDELLIPWYDLEFVDDEIGGERGLERINPSSTGWVANPQVDLPNDGEYGFNVERPHKGKGWVKVNEDDAVTHLIEGAEFLYDNTYLTGDEILSNTFT